jgi:hypothetical protein
MISFSDDVDILRYEPVLFGGLSFTNQVLAIGEDGTLSGTTFTKSGEDFISAEVEPGGVIYLRSADGTLDGGYEIISVDSATQLTVSVLRADREGAAIAPPPGSKVSYDICTYQPQANEIFFQLTQHLGLRPGRADSDFDADDILDTDVLRQVSVFGVLASVYATIGSRSEFSEGFWQKSLYYQKLYVKAKERCRVCIDVDADGVGDITRYGGSMQLVRE